MNIQNEIQKRIAEKAAIIARLSHLEAEAKAYDERMKSSGEDLKSLAQIISETPSEVSELSLAITSHADFCETAKQNLIEIKAEWVVTDTQRLVSPAGFHPDDRIFIQPQICLIFDKKPTAKDIPDSNVRLYLHRVEVN